MEPAKIDWKQIEWVYEEDKLYETINAPKWVDFLATSRDEADCVDDVAWFCRPDCNHPKSAEDFLKFTPTSSKHSRSGVKTHSPFGDLNQKRNGKPKRRGPNQSSIASYDEEMGVSQDSENQNPNHNHNHNFSTPPNFQIKSMKALFKSSSERRKPANDDDAASEANLQQQKPKLKPTLSAKNLFAGKDILGHISEFYNELKKMAIRSRDKEEEDATLETNESQVAQDESAAVKEEDHREVLGVLDLKEKTTPPPGVGKDKLGGRSEKGSSGKKLRRKIRVDDDAENIVPASLNLETVKKPLQQKGEEQHRLLQIPTNPPSPQCFSAGHAAVKTTPSGASKSRLVEKSILQEVKQQQETVKQENREKGGRSFAIVDGKESKTALDMFWFLKPCTLSS
ncbi:unnamed protein product [Linum tenue]|uniref:Uncharacterized protein n=1 Tax=Linum tenue TaxID=586396 RepID=A0AAV0L9N0_9ROSI|nr:unnamed protein product [Linum tenue]